MIDTLYAQIGLAVVVIVVAWTFLAGDEPERIGGGAYGLGLIASMLFQNSSPLAGPVWGLMIVDSVMLAVYIGLSWKSRRLWPVWAAALQALIVMTHLLAFTDLRPPVAAFYAVINLASFGILMALALGAAGSWRDRRAA